MGSPLTKASADVSSRKVLFVSVVHLIYQRRNKNGRHGTPQALRGLLWREGREGGIRS